jgi:hypothetical protein
MFAVTTFNVCLEDNDDPSKRVLIQVVPNATTAAYRFICGQQVFAGTGKIEGNRPGSCLFGLTHNTPAWRVRVNWSTNTKSGEGSVQAPPGSVRCTVQDRDMNNNACANTGGPPPPVSGKSK